MQFNQFGRGCIFTGAACIALLLTSCTNTHKTIDVVYTSSWQNEYNQELLAGCRQDSQILVEAIIEIKPELIELGVDLVDTRLYKYLLDGCAKHLKLSV